MAEPIDHLLLTIPRDIRKEQADQRALLLSAVDAVRRMDKRILALQGRIVELCDDLDLMLERELLGSRTHFETV